MNQQAFEKNNQWCVYMVRCSDNSLYTGITTDIARRLKEHNGLRRGAAYTRSRRPVILAYTKFTTDRASASRIEGKIKQLPRTAKEQLTIEAAPSLAKVST